MTFQRIDGGNGSDTLCLDGSGLMLNLTTLADNKLTNIEAIDIRGSGANTLTLNVLEVLNVTANSNPDHTANTLNVRRDYNDTVNIGTGWTSGATTVIDGVSYLTFTQGAATLRLELYSLLIGGPGTAKLVNDPVHPGDNVLVVVGTSRDDQLHVHSRSSGSIIRVQRGSTLLGEFRRDDVDRILVFGLAGNDTIHIALERPVPTELHGNAGNDVLLGDRLADQLFGGDGNDKLEGRGGDDFLFGEGGNDRLNGGTGNNVLVGGANNDILYSGNGRNVLIGGLGADKLTGGSGDDLLVAGYTDHDSDTAALTSIVNEWSSSAAYLTRVAHLRMGGGLNGMVLLKTGPGATVHDDPPSRNTLTGASGRDWFFARTPQDMLSDLVLSGLLAETLDQI